MLTSRYAIKGQMGIDNIGIPQAILTRENTEPVNEEDRLPNEGDGTSSLRDQERQQDIKDREADRELRKTYAQKAFWFAWIGFGFWALVITCYVVFFLWLNKRFFSDAVLIAITSATTVNLFAAFIGVIRGLFPPAGKHDKHRTP